MSNEIENITISEKRLKLSSLIKSHNLDAMWIADTRDMSILGLAKTFSGNKFKIIYNQNMQLGIDKKDLLHTIRFSKIDAWITLLPFLAEQVRTMTKFDHSKIHIIPFAVDVATDLEIDSKEKARDKFNLPQNKFVMGIIGRVSRNKGQLFLVEQLAELRKQNVDVELLIVGEKTREESDDYYNSVINAAKNLNVTDYVHFSPFLDNPRPFYTAVDLFVMASKAETFGIVTIEAMKLGVPVLGNNSAGTPEILNHGELGYLFEINEEGSFVNRMKQIIQNPDELLAKKKLAQQHADTHFSQDSVCIKIIKVLESLN